MFLDPPELAKGKQVSIYIVSMTNASEEENGLGILVDYYVFAISYEHCEDVASDCSMFI